MSTNPTPQTTATLEAETGALQRRHDELTEEATQAARALDEAQEAAIEGRGEGTAVAVTEAQARCAGLEGTLGRVAERLASAEARLQEAERVERVEALTAEALAEAKAAETAKAKQQEMLTELAETFGRLVAEHVAEGRAYDEARRAVARLVRQAVNDGAEEGQVWAALAEGGADFSCIHRFDYENVAASQWPAPARWPDAFPDVLKEGVRLAGGRIATEERQARQREAAEAARLAAA